MSWVPWHVPLVWATREAEDHSSPGVWDQYGELRPHLEKEIRKIEKKERERKKKKQRECGMSERKEGKVMEEKKRMWVEGKTFPQAVSLAPFSLFTSLHILCRFILNFFFCPLPVEHIGAAASIWLIWPLGEHLQPSIQWLPMSVGLGPLYRSLSVGRTSGSETQLYTFLFPANLLLSFLFPSTNAMIVWFFIDQHSALGLSLVSWCPSSSYPQESESCALVRNFCLVSFRKLAMRGTRS